MIYEIRMCITCKKKTKRLYWCEKCFNKQKGYEAYKRDVNGNYD